MKWGGKFTEKIGRKSKNKTKNKTGSGLRFCDSITLAPRSFGNTTVESDRESQIASLTPVSPKASQSVTPKTKRRQ
jgi:hypothetical protein